MTQTHYTRIDAGQERNTTTDQIRNGYFVFCRCGYVSACHSTKDAARTDESRHTATITPAGEDE